MAVKINFVERVTIYNSDTICKFGNGKFEFAIVKHYKKNFDHIYCKIQNVIGDFDITKIVQAGKSVPYSKADNIFLLSLKESRYLTFYISTNDESDDEFEIMDYESEMCENSFYASGLNETCLESVFSSPSESDSSTLNKTGITDADVVFITSDSKEIPTNRKVLTQFSNILPQILTEETKQIYFNLDDFSADVVKAGIDFLNGNPNAIKEKETGVLKFAAKYDIQKLINACCSSFEEILSPSNVCEFIQIAYSHNFEELKQKCLKILNENMKEIGKSQISLLPKNILLDAYFSQ